MLNKIKIFISVILLAGLLSVFSQVTKAQEKVFLTLFYSTTCPHCTKEKAFLAKLEKKYSNLEIRLLEASKYSELFAKVSQRLDQPTNYVPYTVIGDQVINGYLSDETTGAAIEEIVKQHGVDGCLDIVGQVMVEQGMSISPTESQQSCPSPEPSPAARVLLAVPFLGSINATKLSLPLLTLLVGFLDGFNPCAMWILLFLLTLLINLKDRRKLIILGSLFIVVSGAVYFIFLAAWLNIFFFLKFVSWLRIAIGVVAIASGVWQLNSYRQQRSGCKATDRKKRQRIFERLKNIVNQQNLVFSITGIVLLAASVNLLELVCSAGLPAIYTQVLTLNHLPWWQYYLYLLLYIFVFMLDDMVVFIVAVRTWQTVGITKKYSQLSLLVGGVVIFVLGWLLIFRPEWIMFA
jgi:glutaredoxin